MIRVSTKALAPATECLRGANAAVWGRWPVLQWSWLWEGCPAPATAATKTLPTAGRHQMFRIPGALTLLWDCVCSCVWSLACWQLRTGLQRSYVKIAALWLHRDLVLWQRRQRVSGSFFWYVFCSHLVSPSLFSRPLQSLQFGKAVSSFLFSTGILLSSTTRRNIHNGRWKWNNSMHGRPALHRRWFLLYRSLPRAPWPWTSATAHPASTPRLCCLSLWPTSSSGGGAHGEREKRINKWVNESSYTSSFLLLVVWPGAPSSLLAPSSKARSP